MISRHSIALAIVSSLVLAVAVPSAAAGASMLISQDFASSSLPEGWTAVDGSWQIQDGALSGKSSSSSQQSLISFGKSFENFQIEMDVTFASLVNADSTRWFGVAWDIPAATPSSFLAGQIRSGAAASNGVSILQHSSAGYVNIESAAGPNDLQVGSAQHVTLLVQGTRATWILAGKQVVTTFNAVRTNGNLGLIVNGATVLFDNIRVSDPGALSAGPPLTIGRGTANGSLAAHRGASLTVPENTLAAIKSADAVAPGMIEFDVQWSKDGIPVVMHDDTVDRTTPGTGPVSTFTADQLQQLDAGSWFENEYSNERVPTVDQVAQLLAASRTGLLVDIKQTLTAAQASTIASIFKRWGYSDRVFYKSRSLTTLGRLRGESPETNRVYSIDVLADTLPALVSKMESVDAVALNLPFALANANPALVADLHARGKSVIVWNLESTCEWLAARQAGADLVTVSDTFGFTAWAAAVSSSASAALPDGIVYTNGERFSLRVTSAPPSQKFQLAIDKPAKIVGEVASDCSGSLKTSAKVSNLSKKAHRVYLLSADGGVVASARIVVKAAFKTTHMPKISGTATVGNRLSIKITAWKPSKMKFAYQWFANGKAIRKATKSTLKLSKAFAGKKISVKVTGQKSGYKSLSKVSASTRKVHKR